MPNDQPRVKRCYLYSADCPKGEIFEGDAAIAEAQENGWQDTPPTGADVQEQQAEQASLQEQVDQLNAENLKLNADNEALVKRVEELEAEAKASAASAKPKSSGGKKKAAADDSKQTN